MNRFTDEASRIASAVLVGLFNVGLLSVEIVLWGTRLDHRREDQS